MFTGATIVSCLGGISSGMLLSAIGRRQLHKIDFEESLKTLETLKKLRAIGGDDGVAANLAPYFHVQENPRKINWGLFLGGATMGLLVYLLVGSKITQYLSRESQKFLPTEVNPYSPLLIIATTLSGDLGAISSGILSLAIGRKILNKIDRAERFEARKSPSEAIQD
jgi:NhaP-type Na+/H+ or K+/H+ antiporter